MNWLIQLEAQFKNMPLPFDWPRTNNGDLSRQLLGLQNLDRAMNEDTALQEQQKQPQYVGSGTQGVAVQLPNGNIGKYTNADHEIQNALHLLTNKCPCLATVFDVTQVQLEPELFLIEMEKVQPLNPTERLDIERLYLSPNTPQSLSYLQPYLNELLRCIAQNGFYIVDFHGHNLGWSSNGNLVILDLGSVFQTH